jgi:hypothetical protein
LAVGSFAAAQVAVVQPGGTLDPSRAVAHVQTVASFHTALPEEYIWTADDAAVAVGTKQLSQLKRDDWKVEPHFFRATFKLEHGPGKATLYVAGPRSAKVFINGVPLAEMHYAGGHHMSFGTMAVDVGSMLHLGTNVIAIAVVRGYGSHHHTNALKTSWLNSGEVLAVKIVPVAEGVDEPAMIKSDGRWKSVVGAGDGWENPGFDDSAWKPVVSLGGIESSPDFFQWNADTGMYNWPGYFGAAPYVAAYRIAAVRTTQRADGVLLDFGRELSGRVVLRAGGKDVSAKVRYGESLGELQKASYVGDVAIHAAAGSEARGPKSGFRYALISFEGDAGDANVLAEGIYYPAVQVGSFESSDERLNKIWETAVYNAHLSMQDSILDGIKRDRGRWIGDDEVIHRVVGDVYGDAPLVKAGLEDAIGPSPVTESVNGLPGYSAWWVVSEAEYVRRWGDVAQFKSVQARMLELLARMDRDVDARGVYTAASGGKPFVDWSKDFSGDSAEARRAVHFEYTLAFRDAAWLLRLTGDGEDAVKWNARADAMNAAALKYLADDRGAYGDRWQTNAIAVLAGAVTPEARHVAVWRVLERTVAGRKPGDVITPYYGSYLLSAMAQLGHRREALQWMESYWGGMLDNGATSFWEAWDPAWAGPDPHSKLEADDKVGYNASLAHGWSSGPAAWLMEEVLGVKALAPGFGRVEIRPELAGLEWARGTVATPRGPIRVTTGLRGSSVTLPPGVTAEVILPKGRILMDGKLVKGELIEDGSRQRVVVKKAGRTLFATH